MLRRALSRRAPKTLTEQQGGMRLMLSAISRHTTQAFVLILAFYVAMTASGLAGAKLQSWLWTLLVLAFYLRIGRWVNAAVVDYFQRRRTRLQQQDPSAATGCGLLLFFLRVGIWIIVIVSALACFRYPIAGLIGALGVSPTRTCSPVACTTSSASRNGAWSCRSASSTRPRAATWSASRGC
jgi:hypothetical protein